MHVRRAGTQRTATYLTLNRQKCMRTEKRTRVCIVYVKSLLYCYYCCYCYGFDMDFEFGRVHVCAMDGRAIASECRFTCN